MACENGCHRLPSKRFPYTKEGQDEASQWAMMMSLVYRAHIVITAMDGEFELRVDPWTSSAASGAGIQRPRESGEVG